MVSKRWFFLVLVVVLAVAAVGCIKGPAPNTTGTPPDAVHGSKPKPGAMGQDTHDLSAPEQQPTAGEAGAVPQSTSAPASKWTGTAQDFEAKGFDGKTFKISDYAGQPVVLNFWAAWCPPCVGEFADFQKVYDAKKGQFVMISIAVDSEQDPEKFVKDKGYNWIFAHDTDGAKKYNIDVIPQTFFISASGSLVESQKGGMDINTFEQKLSKLLAK
jgi:peroxiredoxin